MASSHPSFPGITRTEQPVPRPPSPPYIHIPTTLDTDDVLTLYPITTLASPDTAFDLGGAHPPLSRADLETITRNRPQSAPRHPSQTWSYESRRAAQPILDFLYLGPVSSARDAAFLRREGITMLLAARDTRQARARLLAVEKSARELGLAADYVDVEGRQELVAAMPAAVAKINAHLLARAREGGGARGKVLVCCETGNERSAALVAAYLMTVYDADMVRALQFIHFRRFCANFDDDIKFLLRSYGDIIAARRMVQGGQPRLGVKGEDVPEDGPREARAKSKRGIADTMEWEGDEGRGDQLEADEQRFLGRHLTPFVDSSGDEEMAGLGG